MPRFPPFNLIFATLVITLGSSFQHGYTYSWTNSAQKVMTQYLERSFNATYGYELSESETHLLWSAIVTMKSLGLIIGAEAGKSLLNSLSIQKSLKNISEEA